MWYCASLLEWIVVGLDPRTLNSAEGDVGQCYRSVSSSTTFAPSPLQVAQWAFFRNDAWLPSAESTVARCVDNCAVLSIWFRAPMNEFGRWAPHSDLTEFEGMYELAPAATAAASTTTPLYRLTHRANGRGGPPAVLAFEDRGAGQRSWFIATVDLRATGPARYHVVLRGTGDTGSGSDAALHRSPALARTWFRPSSPALAMVQDLFIQCVSAAPNVAVMNVSTDTDLMTAAVAKTAAVRSVGGTYMRTSFIVGGRPVYRRTALEPEAPAPLGKIPAGDFWVTYCRNTMEWRIATAELPTGATVAMGEEAIETAACVRGPAWATTERTGSMYPTMDCMWRRLNGTSTVRATRKGATDRVDVVTNSIFSAAADEVAAPVRTDTMGRPSARDVSDHISDCKFVGNTAEGSRAAGGAAGALLITTGRGHYGDERAIFIRNVNFTGNDARRMLANAPLLPVLPSSHTFSPTRATDTALGQAAGALFFAAGTSHTAQAILTDVTASGNAGTVGAVYTSNAALTLQRAVLRYNAATRSGGAVRVDHGNCTMLQTSCTRNAAALHGGCTYTDEESRFTASARSDLSANVAGREGSAVASSGHVLVSDSRVQQLSGMAFTAMYLSLLASDVSCRSGVLTSLLGGYGCLDAPPPAGPRGDDASAAAPVAGGMGDGILIALFGETPFILWLTQPVDRTSPWVAWSQATSVLAQGMLSLTMVVFVMQHLIGPRGGAGGSGASTSDSDDGEAPAQGGIASAAGSGRGRRTHRGRLA
jgi:hypothetical protein